MGKAKRERKKQEPLTISVHGRGVHMDIRIEDPNDLGDMLLRAFGMAGERLPSFVPPPFVEQPHSNGSGKL